MTKTLAKIQEFFSRKDEELKNSLESLLDFDVDQTWETSEMWEQIRGLAGALLEGWSNSYQDIYADFDRQLSRCLDLKVLEDAVKEPKNTDKASELYDHLITLLAALKEIPGMDRMDIKECEEILEGKKGEFNWPVLMNFLRDNFVNGSFRVEISTRAVYYLENALKKEGEGDAGWREVLFFVMLLDIEWSSLSVLPRYDRAKILGELLFVSMFVSVPVRYFVKEYLLEATSNFYLVLKYKEIIDWIEQNEETVLLSGGQEKNLKDIFRDVFEKDTSDFVAYVQNLGLAEGERKDRTEKSLAKLLKLYKELKDGLLVKDFTEGKDVVKENEEYRKELEALILYFFVKKDWPKIAEYFKQEKKRVSLEAFLRQIYENLDLNKDVTGEIMADFSEFLQKESILKPEQYLIMFDEKSGEFVWNEDLIK